MGALASYFFVNSLCMLSSHVDRLLLLDEVEVGYGDSYILYDVLHLQNTGVIYRDLSQPPYLPAQYSPLMYMLYSLPGRIVYVENPFIGPRVIVLAAFLSCVVVVVSIVRAVIPARFAWMWGLLLATSIIGFQDRGYWVILIRGDFPGIFFSLLAVRLLLAASPYGALMAGLCAGLATQFKIIFVTALAAGSLWLLYRKRWGELLVFVAAGTFTSAGLYFVFWVHEPRMISQMMALSPGIKDVPGCLKLTFKAIREPVVLLALLAVPSVARLSSGRWALLFLFASISFAIGALVDIQAGGDINYFFEALLALVPAAVLGVFRLIHWASRRIDIAVFLSAVVVFHFLPPKALDLYPALFIESGRQEIAIRNDQFRKVRNVLSGHHIFSTVPRLALLDPFPTLTEPYLMSYMERLGKFNPQPILERVRKNEFDVVITERPKRARPNISWRGVPVVAPDLQRAIEDSYTPHCTMLGALLYFPRNRSENSALAQELNSIGCVDFISDRGG
jgi:hypothetical protein